MATDAPRARGSGGPLRLAQLALFLAGEATWLSLWSLALGRWLADGDGSPVLNPAVTAGLPAVAAAATRLLLATRPRLARASLPALGLALTMLTGIVIAWDGRPPAGWAELGTALATGRLEWRPAAGMALVLLAWWRGLVTGRAPLTLDAVESGFGWAVAALALLFLANAAAPAAFAIPAGTLTPAALVALTVGLIGLPLARLIEQRETAAAREGAPLRVDRHWLTLLLGTVGLLLATALVVAATLTFERLDALLALLAAPLDALLWLLLTVIALPTAILIDALVTFLRQFIQPGQPPAPPPAGASPLDDLRSALANPGELPPWLSLLRLALAAGIGALVVSFLARALFRPPDGRAADEVEEVRDFVWSWAGVRATLWARLRARFRRRTQPAPAATSAPVAPPPDRRQWGPRELYRALLLLGARLGRRRAPAETPHEYEQALAAGALAPAAPALRLLTGLYERDRYDAAPPPAAAVDAGRAALAELERVVAAEENTPTAGSPAS